MQSINKITKDDLADSLRRDIELGGGSMYAAIKRNVVEYRETLKRVSFIGGEIDSYDPNTDRLEVFMNTVRLTEGSHYTIDPASKEIVATSYNGWVYNAVVEPAPNVFEFFMTTTANMSEIKFGMENLSTEVLQLLSSNQVMVQATSISNIIEITEDIDGTTRLPIVGGDIGYYDPTTCALNVYVDGHKLSKDVDYTVDLNTNEIYIPYGLSAESTVEIQMLMGLLADNRENAIVDDIQELKQGLSTTNVNLDIVSGEVERLKSSVSDGKELVAAAITGKGIPTVATDSFATMASNIDSIITNQNIGTATPDKVVEGYTFSNETGMGLVGTMPVFEGGAILPNTEDIVYPAGGYIVNDLVISGDNDLVPENIRYGSTIFTIDGVFTADADITETDIPEGKVAYARGERIVGAAPVLSNTDIIPTTEPIELAPNTVIGNDVAIVGDTELVSENIAYGHTIFNVVGKYTEDATANASNILAGETAYVKGEKVEGDIQSLEAMTLTPTMEDQIIPHGRYMAGDITIKGDENLDPKYIRKGIEIFGVEGQAFESVLEVKFTIMAADAELVFNTLGQVHSIMIATSTGVSTWVPGKYLAPERGLLIPTTETRVTIEQNHITLTLSEDKKTITYTNEYGLQANATAMVFYI